MLRTPKKSWVCIATCRKHAYLHPTVTSNTSSSGLLVLLQSVRNERFTVLSACEAQCAPADNRVPLQVPMTSCTRTPKLSSLIISTNFHQTQLSRHPLSVVSKIYSSSSLVFSRGLNTITSKMSWMDSWSRPSKHAVTPPPLYLTVGDSVPYCHSCGRVICDRRKTQKAAELN